MTTSEAPVPRSDETLIILWVVRSLAVIAVVGLVSTTALVFARSDGGSIAAVSTLTGGAIGALTALLSNIRPQK